MAENTNQMTACSDKKQCFNVNHPLSLTVSAPNQKKKTSFQITSVTIGSRLSNDGGDDSADDLDESHTEDISDIVDISRIIDIENETPSFSEDTFSKDDVFFNSSTSLGSAPVIPTSSQYGLAIVATPDGINNSLPSAIGNNNASGELRVSVTDNVINLGVLNSKHTDSDMRDIHTHSTRNERFKVVKIESTEPFKRGRWMCMDYLDHSMLQTNQSHPIVSNVHKVPETNEISHSNQYISNEVINPPSDPAAVVCVPEDKMGTTFDQSCVVGGAVSLPVDQHQPLTSQNNPTVATAQTLPATFTNISPGQTMTLQNAPQMASTMHAQSMSQVPIQQNMLNANQQHQSLQHQQMQQLLANSNNIAGMQQFQQPSLMQQQTHLVQQHNLPVHPMPMQTSIHSNQQMQPPTSQFPVHQQIQLQQQHLQHQQICQPGVVPQMNTHQQVNAHTQILHSQQAFPSNNQMAPANTMHPSAVTNQPQQHIPQQPQYYIQNSVPVITSQGSLQTTQTAHQGGLHQQNYAATSMPQQQMVNQAAMHTSYQTAANVSPQLQPQLTSNIQQQCYVSHPVATSNSNIVQQTYVSSANASVPCSMIETPSITIPSSGESTQTVDHVHTTTVLLDSLADSTAVLPQSTEEVKAGDEAEGLMGLVRALETRQCTVTTTVPRRPSPPFRSYSASGTSGVAIDNKIEQAMDLVKSHLMFAVREEVEVLKEKIAELMDRINQLEVENAFLKANASPETLAQLASCAMPPPAASQLP